MARVEFYVETAHRDFGRELQPDELPRSLRPVVSGLCPGSRGERYYFHGQPDLCWDCNRVLPITTEGRLVVHLVVL